MTRFVPKKSVYGILAVTAVCFFILEIGIRIVMPYPILTGDTNVPVYRLANTWAVNDAFSAYSAKPNLRINQKTTNSHGFISTPEISLEKEEGETRILFLGGSSTAGAGVNLDDVDTWPWKVAESLQSSLPDQKITFINAGVPGYSSFESFGKLWSRLRFYQPDVIVVFHGWNELYYFNMVDRIHQWRVLDDGDWDIDRLNQKVKQYPDISSESILYKSRLLTYIRTLFATPKEGEISTIKEVRDTFDEGAFEVWRTNLQMIQRTADLIGAELYVAKQATLAAEDTTEEAKKTIRYNFVGMSHEALLRAFEGLYRVIDKEIPADHIIDTTEISGNAAYFYDHIHLTPEGAGRIAEIVSRFLRQRL